MRITLKSPAAGHSAGDTAEVDDEYARWLVGQGYAVEAGMDNEYGQAKAAATRARHAKRSTTKAPADDE